MGLYVSWPVLMSGYANEEQWVHVELLDDFLDDPLHPAVRLDFQVNLSKVVHTYSVEPGSLAQVS
jgi:hypothetical protein